MEMCIKKYLDLRIDFEYTDIQSCSNLLDLFWIFGLKINEKTLHNITQVPLTKEREKNEEKTDDDEHRKSIPTLSPLLENKFLPKSIHIYLPDINKQTTGHVLIKLKNTD